MNPLAGAGAGASETEEKEKKKKKKKNSFWRKKKKKKDRVSDEAMAEASVPPALIDASTVHHSIGGMTRTEEINMFLWCARDRVPEKEKNSHLCTALCDFMFSLSWIDHDYFGLDLLSKVRAALKECDDPEHGELAGDVVAIDLRGQPAYMALKSMGMCLINSSFNPGLKYMKVKVGCTKHGVGKGKLRQAVIDVFEYDDWITVECEKDDVISIKLDSTKDYRRCLGPFWLKYA